MDPLNKLFLFGLGLALGYILARIVDRLRAIEEKVDHMDQENQKNDGGFMEMRYVKDFLYVLVLVITLAGLYQSNEARKEALANSCVAGVESRGVQRATVDAVYSLALGFTVRDNDDPPLTPQEEKELEAYISSLDNFRGGLYDKIKPSDQCLPYVDDDEVEPEPITLDDLLEEQGESNG